MSEKVNAPSPAQMRRRQRVTENRARMVDAAASLFGTVGYVGTTMDAVAAASGMSVQSVYFAFHTKANLLQAAFDQAALGSGEGIPPPLTEWYRAAVADTDRDTALAGFVDGNCQILARTGPLTLAAAAAAGHDAAAAEVYEHNERLRMEVLADVTRHLAAKRPFRQSLSGETATDIVFGLLSPQLYGLLTTGRGWAHQAFVEWATTALHRELWDQRPTRE